MQPATEFSYDCVTLLLLKCKQEKSCLIRSALVFPLSGRRKPRLNNSNRLLTSDKSPPASVKPGRGMVLSIVRVEGVAKLATIRCICQKTLQLSLQASDSKEIFNWHNFRLCIVHTLWNALSCLERQW